MLIYMLYAMGYKTLLKKRSNDSVRYFFSHRVFQGGKIINPCHPCLNHRILEFFE